MVTIRILLNTMPHLPLCLNQAAVVPGVSCNVEVKSLGSESYLPTLTFWVTASEKKLQVRNSISCRARKTHARIGWNPRGRQSNVVDAEPIADTASRRVDPAFYKASGEELPAWEKVQGVTSDRASVAPITPAKEVNKRKFGNDVQDNVDVLQLVEGGAAAMSAGTGSLGCDGADTETWRSSGHVWERQKQRSCRSRPDLFRWRLVVEGVRNPLDDCPESNRVVRDSQHLQEVILFLESLGLDYTELMMKYPMLSTCSVESMRAVVGFLESYKLRRKDVVKVLTNNPYLLGHSVKVVFLPVVRFLLTEVGLKERDVGRVVNRCARLLTSNVDNHLRPTLRFLRSLGFTHMSIVVSKYPTLLASSVENRLIPKMAFLESLGLSKEETVQALIRFPAIFNYSIETNLKPKYSCLVEEMGGGLDDLKAFPQYFGYSLEHRIRPRYQFLKKHNLCLPLADMLKPTDEIFYARFQH